MKRSVTMQLPWPPSGNHQHGRAKTGRTYLTAATKYYRRDVGWLAKCVDTFGTRRIALHITVYPPDARRRDLDNLIKSAQDALQHAGVFKDDSQIDDLHVTRGVVRKGNAYMVVRITEA